MTLSLSSPMSLLLLGEKIFCKLDLIMSLAGLNFFSGSSVTLDLNFRHRSVLIDRALHDPSSACLLSPLPSFESLCFSYMESLALPLVCQCSHVPLQLPGVLLLFSIQLISSFSKPHFSYHFFPEDVLDPSG